MCNRDFPQGIAYWPNVRRKLPLWHKPAMMPDTAMLDSLHMKSRPQIDRIVWDDWNREHITKHDVLPEEVEEVVAISPVFRATYKQRYQVLGPTFMGRMLSVIVGAVPNKSHVYYVFSARPASRSERRIYTDLQKGDLDT